MGPVAPGTELPSGGVAAPGAGPQVPITVDRVVGESAQGWRYAAHQSHTPLLVTVIDRAVGQLPDLRESLVRHLDAARAIHHRNILPLYGMTEFEDLLVVIREEPHGQSVRNLIHHQLARGQSLDANLAIRVACALCAALELVHQGAAHGCITADAVFVREEDDRVLLSDLGEGAVIPFCPSFDRFVAAGLLPLGPELLAPPHEPTHASDVFAVAALTVEMLSGQVVEAGGALPPLPGLATGPRAALHAALDPSSTRRPTPSQLAQGLSPNRTKSASPPPPPPKAPGKTRRTVPPPLPATGPKPGPRVPDPLPPLPGEQKPDTSYNSSDWDALERATRGEMKLDEGISGRAAESALGLKVDAFGDVAQRLTTIDGDSGLIGLAASQEDAVAGAKREDAYFGSFADESGSQRPQVRDPDLVTLDGHDPHGVVRRQSSNDRFLITRNGVDQGPFTVDDLELMIQQGQLRSTEKLRVSGRVSDEDELMAVDHPRLRPIFEQAVRIQEAKLKAVKPPPTPRAHAPVGRGGGSGRGRGTLLWIMIALAIFGAAAWVVVQRAGS